jgi:hypothetical protein
MANGCFCRSSTGTYAPWSNFEGVRQRWFWYVWTENDKRGFHGQSRFSWGFRILGWSFAWEPDWCC